MSRASGPQRRHDDAGGEGLRRDEGRRREGGRQISQERYDPKDPKFEAMPVISIKHTEKTLLEIGHESIDTVYRCVKAICSEYEKTKELALKTLLEMKLKELGYEVEIDGDELLKAVAKATPSRRPNRWARIP
jgi:hypothetical protein